MRADGAKGTLMMRSTSLNGIAIGPSADKLDDLPAALSSLRRTTKPRSLQRQAGSQVTSAKHASQQVEQRIEPRASPEALEVFAVDRQIPPRHRVRLAIRPFLAELARAGL